jgi:uncharacterized protein (TIGR03437 family)
VLTSTPDTVTKVYPTTISPDAVSATQRNLSVTFYQAGTSTVLGVAPVLFATNNQINVLVPSGVSSQIGSNVDVIVRFGYGTVAATMKTSAVTQVKIVATNPGIFTVGADGQGDGAALDGNWALINQSNPSGIRSGATDSDFIQIYMTGLGAPDSAGDNASAGAGPTAPADCVSTASYMASLNSQTGASLTAVDGAIIQSGLLNSKRIQPCLSVVPTATVGGVSASVSFAGWVADSVAGLYQVNLQLPRNTGSFTNTAGVSAPITAPVQLPVVITTGAGHSQSNVSIWIAPRLNVTGPSGSGLTGKVGAAWSSSNNAVTAIEGTGPYQYMITSGVLPSGLAMTGGVISGTPALNTAGSYVLTVTAIDSATPPVTGTVSFTLVVGGGLALNGPGSAVTVPALTANTNIAQVIASGGSGAITYGISATPSLPTGMTINPATGQIGVTASTPAGNYVVTVTASDSTTPTPLTGAFTFTVNVKLKMSVAGNGSTISAASGGVVTVTAASGTGSYTYAMTSPSSVPTGWTFDPAAGTITIGATAGAATTSVTVTATDTTAGTPLTGTINFNITVGP